MATRQVQTCVSTATAIKLNLVMAQDLTDLNSITINNGGPVLNGDGINMGGKKITDLAAGTDDTDAVNVSQLKDVSEVANAGWNVSANGATARECETWWFSRLQQ